MELLPYLINKFEQLGLVLYPNPIKIQSIAQNSFDFNLNEHKIIFREAHETPTKIGQFVSIWKRNNKGITIPFEENDAFNLMIINACNTKNNGLFIFPKNILTKHGIISSRNKEGKRGMRVYPTWDIPNNKQAFQTQNWQRHYFINLEDEISLNKKIIESIFQQ